jgi:glycosyltransferase involved in cell wall biosynthesis
VKNSNVNTDFSGWVYLQIAHLFPHWSPEDQKHLIDQIIEGDAASSKAGRIALFEARQDKLRDKYTRFQGPWLRRLKDLFSTLQLRRGLKSTNKGGQSRPVSLNVNPVGPRIFHAIPDFMIGGAAQLVYDIVAYSQHTGPQIIYASRATHRPPSGLPVSIHTYTTRAAAQRLLERNSPDLVHFCHYDFLDYQGSWSRGILSAAEHLGIPIVQTHCVIGQPWLGSHTQNVVYCSNWSASAFGASWLQENVIYPGTPFELFTGDYRAPRKLPVVGMAYRLGGDKMDVTSAYAIAEVLRQVPNARMRIVGKGTLEERFRQIFNEYGCQDRVEWLGWLELEDLRNFYRSLDLVLAPVITDTFGSGSVHAIVSGRPVLGPRTGALPEILCSPDALTPPLGIIPQGLRSILGQEPLTTKNLAEPTNLDSPAAFGRQAAALLKNPDLHLAVHQIQLKQAEANFTVERMVERYESLFAATV